jgi:hypothetical protein
MNFRAVGGARVHAGVVLFVCALPLLSLSAAACGGASPGPNGGQDHDQFTVATNDEYTEALTNAVIGTPAGVISVDAKGSVSALVPVPTGGAASDAGQAIDAGPPSDSGILVGEAGGPPLTGDDGGVSSDDGGGISPLPDGGVGASSSFGQWHFDDCSPKSHFLLDSSGAGANAQQALKAACVSGISGLGVQFRTAKDIVQVPDEPQFTVASNVAVAAWVNPNTVTGDQPIVLKRLNNKTSFSLGIHKGNIEMSVVLANGKTVISQAPIAAGTWSHVAGLYDGTFLFLFINGQQFGQVFAGSALTDVFAPIRIGATTQSQHFDGIIDEVFLTMQPISKDALTALACISRPTTVAVNPLTSGPVPFDTTVHYDITVNDNDVGFCPSTSYEAFNSGVLDPGITANFSPFFVSDVLPGGTAAFGADVTGSDDADPGVHTIPFTVFRFGQTFEQVAGQLTYDLSAPTGCFVSTRHELMITDLSVVDDPVRTFGVIDPGFGDGGVVFSDAGSASGGGSASSSSSGSSGGTFGGSSSGPVGSSSGGVGPTPVPAPGPSATGDGGASVPVPLDSPSLGVWTFGHLLRELAPTPADAPALVEKLFDHWLTDQQVNGFTVSARPAIQPILLDIWPRTPDGALDLDQSPLRLQAIVNRTDLRNLAAGSAGEGRFVFGVNGPGFPQQFTVILEYNLPATTAADAATWASLWHGLASHPFPSEEYNAALEALTRRFAGRGASPGSINGSALINLRTNEIALSDIGRWEFREFNLSPTTGFFDEATVKETPDLGFNGSSRFADFVNQNAAAIISEIPGANDGTVSTQFEGSPFLGGSVFNDLVEWSAPGITNDDARFHASLNTCNGCHGPESNTTFLQISPRFPGSEAFLSPFLTGTTVTDPAGQTRTLNDLGRRKTDFTSVVCGPTDAGPPPPPLEAGAPPPPFEDAAAPVPLEAGVVVVK